ncbi:MAG: RlmI/RlmK family 23S rRNA methyltransferase, partial [Pseudomonadota bacterium]|nr:RlmI/RlmK family 23S rRNA methyltransferase [Pseudomonadota bacterium]
MMTLPRLRIKKREQQRLRDGHLWVYSNEVDTTQTPLKAIQGHLVHLEDYRGQLIGTASFI